MSSRTAMRANLTADVRMQSRVENAWWTTYEKLNSQNKDGHWTGELSTSALSTATAVSALSLLKKHHPTGQRIHLGDGVTLPIEALDEPIRVGCQWLADHQNEDGGFGDTDRSHSNIATSLLVQAAWQLGGFHSSAGAKIVAVNAYIDAVGKWDALRRRYGTDKTFVVPILTNCALAGLVEWSKVPSLPFEAAWLPQSWYRLARLPVVSYAIPALVAMGQAKFHFRPPRNPLAWMVRRQAIQPTLNVLRRMQPDSGGYLEAVPLTSFVLMSLAAVGHGHLKVATECARFILDSRLNDGSWPIDTNLATWLTSLTIFASSRRSPEPQVVQSSATGTGFCDPRPSPKVVSRDTSSLITSSTVRWLLSCQHRKRHPFTGATPGGWGWTDLSGAVPDADDTPAALLALASLDLLAPAMARLRTQTHYAVGLGLNWLIQLQNRNGGWPTFCRGWGKLPFDRSGTDLTAHALRAFQAWLPHLDEIRRVSAVVPTHSAISASMNRGLRYLRRHQQPDGSWLPLWFGNQDHPVEDNPVYGTAKALIAYAELGLVDSIEAQKSIEFLIKHQNLDGGWGGGSSVSYSTVAPVGGHTSSIEETALSLEALIQCGGGTWCRPIIMGGLKWLVSAIEGGNLDRSWPIGFYFAKLWYHEKLYPAIFALAALGAALRQVDFNLDNSVS
jgi:squalene-hopene/tetraprenyl-beta-curcumene cyclase